MLAVNTLLQGRYRIVRQLGQGGMGAVYKAVDKRIDKTVAIKEILLELEHSSDKKQKEIIKQAFRREASSLVKARHEAVPDVTDFFSEFDREFLVMEFVEGDDLTKMLQKRKAPFLIEEVLPWIEQLLVALDYLHNLKPPIIHRDIKPQNLKLNEREKIKLLDFGVAKSTDKTATLTQLTFIGATLSYSPIEQILRVIDPMFRELILLKHKENAERVLAQNTDSRCDIFALGATFYHLLTNYPPVDITKRTLEVWEGKIDPLPNPSEINPALPESISDWLVKSMAIERDDRFSSALEMQNALNEAIGQLDSETQAENAPDVADPAYLQKEIEQRDEQERVLMQAKTVRLIDLPDPKESEVQIAEDTMVLPNAGQNEQPTDTFSTSESSATDFKFTDTDISIVNTDDNLSGLEYVDKQYVNDQKTAENSLENIGFVPPSNDNYRASASKNLNYLLILPIVGILGFVVLGGGLFSFLMWMNYSGTPGENKSTIENRTANTAKTPEVEPSVEPSIPPADTKSDQITDAGQSKPDSSKPAVNETPAAGRQTQQPATNPVINQTPKPVVIPTAKTPIPTSKPTKATPKKKPPSEDCIYNARCP